MEEEIGENLGLSRLAAEVGLSPHHFARAFRGATGRAPRAWLIERRVARAADMLFASVPSIAEIAHACGLSSQAHMPHVFTRRLGVSPGRRRAIRRA